MNAILNIEEKLKANLNILKLISIDESHKHNVPKGTLSHLRLFIVSDDFIKLSKIQRQQKIYGILKSEMNDFLHALTMQTLTVEEYQNETHEIEKSPKCLGGSKK